MGDDRNDAPKSNLQIPCPGREGRRSKAIPQNENWPQEDSEKGLRPWSRRSLAQLNGPVAQFQAIFEKITLKGVILKSIRLGSIELHASEQERKDERALLGAVSAATASSVSLPFETEQLARYYAQVLAQSKTSFWFSLVFASIGFLIIVLGAFTHASSDSGSTIARFLAGGIVDSVAALFFIQSKRAQDSMADFFDKLRRDRNHVEARKLCDSVDTASAKDALRVRLSLHYAEVGSPDAIADGIIKACLVTTSPSTTEKALVASKAAG